MSQPFLASCPHYLVTFATLPLSKKVRQEPSKL